MTCVRTACVVALTVAVLAPGLPAADATKPPANKKITITGCVTRGVEAGCLIVKDKKTNKTYNVFFKDKTPSLDTAIRATGTKHNAPTTCMQGVPVDVTKWTELRMHCPPSQEPPK